MTEKVTGIVLGSIRHNDRHDITSIYTRERGRVAVATPATGTSRKRSGVRRGALMPLSVVSVELSAHGNSEIRQLRQISPLRVWQQLYFDPRKIAISMFVTEFLDRLSRESGADANLWDYVEESIGLLDALPVGTALANFPITLLSTMTLLLGIAPDTSGYSAGMIFDMRAGVFTAFEPGHSDVLRDADAAMAAALRRITFANSGRFRMNVAQRRKVLELLLRYYSIHLPGLGSLKSPEVLSQLLG